jgi:hypothetical protein
MNFVEGKKVPVGKLDLPPGYSAERGEADAYLVDPDGRRVMQLPGRPDPEPDGWQELTLPKPRPGSRGSPGNFRKARNPLSERRGPAKAPGVVRLELSTVHEGLSRKKCTK